MKTPYPMPLREEADDDLYIGEITRLLKRRWRRTLIMTATATLLAVGYVMSSEPVFSVSGTLYLGNANNGGNGGNSPDSSSLGFTSDFQSTGNVQTQIELIQANALIERAVLETGLNAQISGAGTAAIPYWQWWMFHGRQVSAFAPKSGELMAQFASVATPTGTGRFELVTGEKNTYQVFSTQGWPRGPQLILSGTYGQPASGDGLSLLMKPAGNGPAPEPGRRFMLQVLPASAIAQQLLAKGLSVTSGGTFDNPSQVATVALRWSNPYAAEALVNRLMQDYIDTRLSWKTESASNVETFISTQLDNIRASLAAADRDLSTYQAKIGIIDVSENARDEISVLSQYEVQRTNVELQKEFLLDLAADIERPDTQLNPYMVSQSNDPVVNALAERLADAEIKLGALNADFTPGDANVRVQSAQVESIKRQIKSVVNNDLMLANSNLANINRMIENYQKKLKDMPADSLKIISLKRTSDVLGQLYVLLMNKQQEAEVLKAATIIDARVVTPAELPFVAASPKPTITVLGGLFAGLFAAMALVLGERAFSGQFYSDEEVRRYIPLPVYGLIPERRGGTAEFSRMDYTMKGPFPESFRMLRSNIYHSGQRQQSFVIAVTSATCGDGKTTIANNLAKAFADDGKSVVFVNADLHASLPSRTLPANHPGLTEWLLGTARPEFFKPHGQRFNVVATGVLPPNPSELLNAASFDEVITELRKTFEYIIIDCPPLPVVADSMAIGQRADLILSVVRIDHTKRTAFRGHLESLRFLERRQGMVVNGGIADSYSYDEKYTTANALGYVSSGWRIVVNWLVVSCVKLRDAAEALRNMTH